MTEFCHAVACRLVQKHLLWYHLLFELNRHSKINVRAIVQCTMTHLFWAQEHDLQSIHELQVAVASCLRHLTCDLHQGIKSDVCCQDVESTTEVPGTPPGTRPTTPPSASPGSSTHITPPSIASHITPGQPPLQVISRSIRSFFSISSILTVKGSRFIPSAVFVGTIMTCPPDCEDSHQWLPSALLRKGCTKAPLVQCMWTPTPTIILNRNSRIESSTDTWTLTL